MTVIQSMLESSYTQRLGWALLHSLWQGAAVALVLMLCQLMMRKAAAQVKYVVSCGAMLAVLALPLVTFFWLKPNVREVASRSVPREQGVEPSAGSAVRPPVGASGSQLVVTPVFARETSGTDRLAAPGPRWLVARPVVTRIVNALQSAAPWLVLAWVMGVAGLSIWNLGGWVALQRLKFKSGRTAEGEIRDLCDRIRRRLNLGRAVGLLISNRIGSPMVIGVFKPVILLPASVLCDLSAAQLESILAHELGHVRRHDYLVNLVQSVIETLLFFHPAVWWIGRRIRIERENCCDDIALSLTRDRETYVRALTLVAAGAPALAPAAAGGFLLARVRRILGLPAADVARAPRWLSGALVLALAFGFGTVVQPNPPATLAAVNPPQTQPTTMTLTILDEDSGKPIEGANISVSSTEKIPKTVTDASGIAVLKLPHGNLSMNVWARKDGYVPTLSIWGNSKGQDPIPPQFTMKIARGKTIGGTVVDEQGAPIGGVTVSINVPRAGVAMPRVMTQVYDDKFTTDDKGQWHCSIIPPDAKNVVLRLEHPRYASDAMYGDTGRPALDELLNMTDVLTMKAGLTVNGQIVGVQGEPIGGATVTLGQNSYGMHAPTARTNDTGHFTLQHCRPNDNATLVVTAVGRCPDVEQFPLRSDKSDVLARLKPAKPLVVRVVDAQGRPLPDSRLFIQTWRNWHLLNWDARTDAQGRVVWNEAPDDTVYYCIYHEGYVQQTQTPLLANGIEHKVTLVPELKVYGKVVDDMTGQPLDKFQIIKGWTSGGKSRPFWERDGDRKVINYPDGKFQISEDVERDGYAIRIEADGYAPSESKVFYTKDGDVSFTFRMKQADDTIRTLTSLDGRPLAGADVLIANGSAQIIIKNGKVEDQSTFAERTKADDKGQFRLKPQAGEFKLLIVHDLAFGLLSPADLAGLSPIKVPAWASVEGTARSGAKQAAGRTVAAMGRPMNPPVSTSSESTVAADGTFRLPHVAPGTSDVGLVVPLGHSGSMTSYGYEQQSAVDLKAGESKSLILGGMGRPVTGHVAIPPSLSGQIDPVTSHCAISSRLHLPGRALPPDWEKMEADARGKWNQQWSQTPEVRRYEEELKNAKRFAIKLGSDGSFRVEDVPAGAYEFSLQVYNGSPLKPIASARQEFTVDPMADGRSDRPLDLGTIAVAALNVSKVGEVAPAFDVPTVDGKRVKLSDYRGKYVLVDFWATWCGPCVEETPFLKAAWNAFGGDSRFAMISLSVDDQPDAPRKFATNQQTPWAQGFVGPFAQTDLPGKWGVEGIPSIFLIGPDGRILARGLRGEAIKSTVAQKLGDALSPHTQPGHGGVR